MRLLLINPKEESVYPKIYTGDPRDFGILFAPLSLQILTSLTPPEIEVTFTDENFEKVNFDGVYDLVGITSRTSTTNPAIKRLYAKFRERGVRVVLGGIFPSLNPQSALSQADSIVIGEAEDVWLKVLHDAKIGKLKKIYKGGMADLHKHAYPLPRRDVTSNRRYISQAIEVSRGCPYQCDFCTISSLNRGKYRLFPISRVIEDAINAKSNPASLRDYVYLSDDNLTINPTHKIKLLKKLVPYGFTWFCHSDINIAKNTKLLDIAAKSGCYELWIGFESISQDALHSLNKHHVKVSYYKKAVQKIHDRGIRILGFFMVGMDTDMPGIGRKTLEVVNDIGIDNTLMLPIIPMEGTKFFMKLKKEGRILNHLSEDAGKIPFKMKHLNTDTLINEIEFFNAHKKLIFKSWVSNKNLRWWKKAFYLLPYRLKTFEWMSLLCRRRVLWTRKKR